MSRRTRWIERPGTGGVVTDLAAHQLGPRELVRGADAIMPNGLIRQRRGWAYDGTTADVADNLVGVARAKFILAGTTETVTCDDDGDMFVHNASASGTAIFTGTVQYLPRCIYRDQVVWCAQDGVRPIELYSGGRNDTTETVTNTTFTAGQSILTALAGSWSSLTTVGGYAMIRNSDGTNYAPDLFLRILEKVSSTVLTLEDIKTSGAGVGSGGLVQATGRTFPCVNVYEAGTGSFDNANNEFDGTGTKWATFPNEVLGIAADCLLVMPDGSPAEVHYINTAASVTDTLLDLDPLDRTYSNTKYNILRRCPFKDAATHKESLWGTGVDRHQSRVYVGPPGWNPALPPGFTTPYDPSVFSTADNHLDFLMDFVDVGADSDADPCVALIPSPNPLIVPKRENAYGIYGVYGSLDVAMLPEGEGSGCIDLRSAFNLSIGPVWAGPNGVHAFIGGRVVNLCAGRIEREWQALTNDFDYGTSDYCTIGEKGNVLVVHLTTGGGATQRTWHLYPYDDTGKLNPRWLDRVSNFSPRYMFSSRVPGEEDRILAVQNTNQGRVIDYGPALDGTGIARDGDGDTPVLDLTFGSRLARDAGADVDERLLELAVEANLYDTAGTGSTLGGSVASSQSLDSTATTTTTLTTMASKNADLVKPYVHRIGVKAGLHQLRLTKGTTQTTEQTTEISRIGVTVRASKRPL